MTPLLPLTHPVLLGPTAPQQRSTCECALDPSGEVRRCSACGAFEDALDMIEHVELTWFRGLPYRLAAYYVGVDVRRLIQTGKTSAVVVTTVAGRRTPTSALSLGGGERPICIDELAVLLDEFERRSPRHHLVQWAQSLPWLLRTLCTVEGRCEPRGAALLAKMRPRAAWGMWHEFTGIGAGDDALQRFFAAVLWADAAVWGRTDSPVHRVDRGFLSKTIASSAGRRALGAAELVLYVLRGNQTAWVRSMADNQWEPRKISDLRAVAAHPLLQPIVRSLWTEYEEAMWRPRHERVARAGSLRDPAAVSRLEETLLRVPEVQRDELSLLALLQDGWGSWVLPR